MHGHGVVAGQFGGHVGDGGVPGVSSCVGGGIHVGLVGVGVGHVPGFGGVSAVGLGVGHVPVGFGGVSCVGGGGFGGVGTVGESQSSSKNCNMNTARIRFSHQMKKK